MVPDESNEVADRLLASYRHWGLAAIGSFLVFLGLLVTAIIMNSASITFLFAILVSGFLWVGLTSLSRHALVVLKRYIGSEINIWEFLLTQFIIVLFPYSYNKAKRDIQDYKKRMAKKMSGDTPV